MPVWARFLLSLLFLGTIVWCAVEFVRSILISVRYLADMRRLNRILDLVTKAHAGAAALAPYEKEELTALCAWLERETNDIGRRRSHLTTKESGRSSV